MHTRTLFVLPLLLLSACASSHPSSQSTKPTTTTEVTPGAVTLEGTLRNDIMAIGSESTGWAIALAEGPLEVDIAAVGPEAMRLAGRRVVASGNVELRDWNIRRGVKTLIITQLAPAPTGSAGPVRIPEPPRPR